MWGESDLAGRLEASSSRQCIYILFFLCRFSISPEHQWQTSSCAHPNPSLKRSCFCTKSSVRMLSGYIQLPKHRQTYYFILYSPLLPVCHLVLLSREGCVYISLIFQKSLVGSTVLLQYENFQASYSVRVTKYSVRRTSRNFPKSQKGIRCLSLFKHSSKLVPLNRHYLAASIGVNWKWQKESL